jgi:uncharacterized membrane protein YsdA (DUF1294 family)
MFVIFIPSWAAMAAWYVVMSVVTFIVYAVDKSAAARGGGRVSERSLHVLELLGGWPGAFVAMSLLRHKRRKPGFVAVVVLIAAAHIAAWIWGFGRPWA